MPPSFSSKFHHYTGIITSLAPFKISPTDKGKKGEWGGVQRRGGRCAKTFKTKSLPLPKVFFRLQILSRVYSLNLSGSHETELQITTFISQWIYNNYKKKTKCTQNWQRNKSETNNADINIRFKYFSV